jgi:hypothetical protein
MKSATQYKTSFLSFLSKLNPFSFIQKHFSQCTLIV